MAASCCRVPLLVLCCAVLVSVTVYAPTTPPCAFVRTGWGNPLLDEEESVRDDFLCDDDWLLAARLV